MNILFIGPYRQNDQWGRKSRAVLKALQNTDHSVTSRPIYMSSNLDCNQYVERSEFIINDHYDILIQFLLQPYSMYDGNVTKRIGIFNTETIPYQIPLGQLTAELLMDEIWTDSSEIRDNLQNILQSYNSNTKVIATYPTLDIENFPVRPQRSIRSHDNDLQNRFIFYWIGNILEDKQGFEETCLAYLNTFSITDPIILVGALEAKVNEQKLDEIIMGYRHSIEHLKPITQQPPIKIVIPQGNVLSETERSEIHVDGDCLVCPHYTTSINLTVLEGVLYKSIPIVNKQNAAYEWLGKKNLWGIESYKDLCISKNKSSFFRFTSGELWHKPIMKSLSETMKNVYVNKFLRDKKIMANAELRQHFEELSYNNILSEKFNGDSS